MPQKRLFFPVGVSELRTQWPRGDARLVAADPISFGDDERGDAHFRRTQWRRHRHAAVGRVDAQIDVLDAFARELVFDAGGGHGSAKIKVLLPY